jgi:deoxyadenosine/deoxycytidine kinase
MARDAPILVVAGNIATGKTHLLEALSSELMLPPFPERWDQNPWFGTGAPSAFAAEMWFLVTAGADHARMSKGGGVQERCIHEHARVFADEMLGGTGAETLTDVYLRLDAQLPDPTLLIYLRATVLELHERIRRRRRPQEQDLTLEQLERLQLRYDKLIGGWKLCPIIEVDTEAIDVRSLEGRRHVLERTSEELS